MKVTETKNCLCFTSHFIPSFFCFIFLAKIIDKLIQNLRISIYNFKIKITLPRDEIKVISPYIQLVAFFFFFLTYSMWDNYALLIVCYKLHIFPYIFMYLNLRLMIMFKMSLETKNGGKMVIKHHATFIYYLL